MKFAFYMNCVSAHQLPLAKEVAELVGPENFCYVDAGEKSESAQSAETQGLKFKVQSLKSPERDGAREWLETADVMLTGMRDLELFERRTKKGLRTYYTSERWFKPIGIGGGGRWTVEAPGSLRMFVPGYRRMVKRFVKWANEDPGARVLAIGPWARLDFLGMGVRADKIVGWGYFVAPSTSKRLNIQTSKHLNILWCGRMLGLKRVDTIIRAASQIKV
ncbi:MAG: glycosyltransferase [bacterium]|nr:glycosyltransferase [Candidatus Colisoma equi]